MSRYRNLTTALAAMLLVAPAVQAVDVTSVGDTKLSVYGFVIANTTYYLDALQKDSYAPSLFYNANGGGAGGNSVLDTSNLPTGQFQFQVKPSRFGFKAVTPSASLGDITAKIEFDENNPSGGPGLRHAYIQFGGWTFGRYWENMVDLDAMADTVDWSGTIGAPGYDTTRNQQIAYKWQFDKQNSLTIAVEQNGGQSDGSMEVADSTTYGAGAGVPDSKIPTFVGAYTYAGTWGHLSVRGLAQNYAAYIAATPTTGSSRYSSEEYTGQLSGDVLIPQNGLKDDLVFDVYSGNAPGGPETGIQSALMVDKGQNIYAVKTTGWMVGYTHNWTSQVRSNLVLSGVSWSANSNVPNIAALVGGGGGANIGLKSAQQAFVNTFVKLAKNTEIGLEYIYEVAKPFNASSVATPTINSNGAPASNNSASKIEFTVHVDF
jgi:hypothetical protein